MNTQYRPYIVIGIGCISNLYFVKQESTIFDEKLVMVDNMLVFF